MMRLKPLRAIVSAVAAILLSFSFGSIAYADDSLLEAVSSESELGDTSSRESESSEEESNDPSLLEPSTDEEVLAHEIGDDDSGYNELPLQDAIERFADVAAGGKWYVSVKTAAH